VNGATPALAHIAALGIPHVLHAYELEEPSGVATHRGERIGYGEAAARALGIDPTQLYKSLLLQLEGRGPRDAAAVFAVVPSSATVSERAVAAALGAKRASLAPVDVVRRLTGSVPGGVSPIGAKRTLPVLIDASAESLARIVVSAGRRGLSVELTPADLMRATAGRLAPICAAE
jgi:Cys-tRNA(Pro)/Cys-tRNA(Cys) deacylase